MIFDFEEEYKLLKQFYEGRGFELVGLCGGVCKTSGEQVHKFYVVKDEELIYHVSLHCNKNGIITTTSRTMNAA